MSPIDAQPQGILRLDPATAGPNLTSTSVTISATVLVPSYWGGLVPANNQPVSFTATGANPLTVNARTNANGVASLVLLGANPGIDTVTASSTAAYYGAPTIITNNTTAVTWVSPPPSLTMGPVPATSSQPMAAASLISPRLRSRSSPGHQLLSGTASELENLVGQFVTG